MLHFIDFETFKYDDLCVIINPITKTKTVIVNDRDKLTNYYEKFKDEIFIGYNIRGYDQYIMKGIILGMSPQKINDWIIVQKRKGWEYSRDFYKVPLNIYDVMFGGNSLKKLEGFMGNDIRETTVDFTIDRPLTNKEIEEVVYYCTHDVEQTIEVFLHRKAEFDAQMSLLKRFNLPLKYVGKTQAQLAAIILKASAVTLNDDWDIRLPETLRLTRYQHIADWFMNPDNQNEYSSLTTKICGVEHVFAFGGLHGAIDTFIYECQDDEIMIMADVGQLYPTLMVEYRLLSRAVTDYEDFKLILSESLRLKAIGDKVAREPYKRICNITYGAMGDKYNAMYDPLHRTLVCVYGQLLILMLLEMLEDRVPTFKLIQTNTDGILIKIKEKDFDLVDDIIYEWEQVTRLQMEFEYFKKIYQGDVNNYVGLLENGKVKSKGTFFKKLSEIDNDLPIVNKAIMKYLLEGVPVEKTINDCDELIEFQNICRVSSKYSHAIQGCTFSRSRFRDKNSRISYKNIWNGDGKILNEKTLRVFASKDKSDGGVFKMKDEEKNPEKFPNTSLNSFIFNESVIGVKCPSKLDKLFYINMAKERLKKKLEI